MGRPKQSRMPKKQHSKTAFVDSNTEIIDPSQPKRSINDLEGEQAVCTAATAANTSKMSSKKKKRLAKYIDNKFRREERIRMFAKLAETSYESDLLRSTKHVNHTLSKQQKQAVNALYRAQNMEAPFPSIQVAAESASDALTDESSADSATEESDDCQTDDLSAAKETFAAEELDFFNSNDVEVDAETREEMRRNQTIDKPTAAAIADIVAAYANVPRTSRHTPEVRRAPEIDEKRAKLPVFAREQEIVDAVVHNPVTVVCGSTGSGKTTQVPQFLYEYGFGDARNAHIGGAICITQPRRLAVVAAARRVAAELGVAHGGVVVGHRIRHEAAASEATRIVFVTDGVLLREIAADFLLSRYAVVVLDEAHERSLNTDLLIGLLSRIVRLRGEMAAAGERFFCAPAAVVTPLRLVVMSATLRVGDFAQNERLFSPPPPCIDVAGRLFDVTVHFARRTPTDYVAEAFRRIVRIHRTMPEGTVLCFLTGKEEIRRLCRLLTARLHAACSESAFSDGEDDLSDEDLLDDSDAEQQEAEDLFGDENDEEEDCGLEASKPAMPVRIVPLFAMLSPEEQASVFELPAAGTRLIVVATNVAETSVTIPGVRFVVDCGRVKSRIYDPRTNVQKFVVEWTSKASTEQRTGRAGRTCDGHCFRLFSAAVFEREFAAFTPPEIRRVPIDALCLTMKAMHIDRVANFPFPTPPNAERLVAAESLLRRLQAVDDAGVVTPLGLRMAHFPVAPRLAKILADACADDAFVKNVALMSALLCLVAVVAIGEFTELKDACETDCRQLDASNGEKTYASFTAAATQQFNFMQTSSDLFVGVNAFSAWLRNGRTADFCRQNCIVFKAFKDALLLVSQLERIMHKQLFASEAFRFEPPATLLTSDVECTLVAVLRRAYAENVVEMRTVRDAATRTPKVAYAHVAPPAANSPYFLVGAASVFWRRLATRPPKFLLYCDIQETRSGAAFIRGLTRINRLDV